MHSTNKVKKHSYIEIIFHHNLSCPNAPNISHIILLESVQTMSARISLTEIDKKANGRWYKNLLKIKKVFITPFGFLFHTIGCNNNNNTISRGSRIIETKKKIMQVDSLVYISSKMRISWLNHKLWLQCHDTTYYYSHNTIKNINEWNGIKKKKFKNKIKLLLDFCNIMRRRLS